MKDQFFRHYANLPLNTRREIVAVLDHHVGQGRARHDFHIPLDRDLLGYEAEFGRESGQREPGGDALVLAVDGDRDGAIGMGHGA